MTTPTEKGKIYKQRLKLLEKAAADGDLKTMVELLDLEAGLAEEAKPMFEAAMRGASAAVALLLQRGADPNVVIAGNSGWRPLHRTIRHPRSIAWSADHVAVIELLLQAGADASARAGGFTPLGSAAQVGNREVVDLLLNRGVAVDFFDAALIGDVERVQKELASRPDAARARLANGLTALHCCALSPLAKRNRKTSAAYAAIASLLIDAGADPDDRVFDGEQIRSPLELAVKAGNTAVFRLLLEQGAPPGNALHRALYDQQMTMAEDLLAACPHVDLNPVVDEKLANPLLNEMIRWGKLRAAQWLLERGVDPNSADKNGWTALFYAARRGLLGIHLEAILTAGGRLDVRDAEGKTPLDIAAAHKRRKTLDEFQRWLNESHG